MIQIREMMWVLPVPEKESLVLKQCFLRQPYVLHFILQKLMFALLTSSVVPVFLYCKMLVLCVRCGVNSCDFFVQEMSELRDQLRDLMFFLEAKDTLATTSSATQQEIQEGRIVVQSNASEASGTPSSANKKPRTKKR